MPRVIASYQPRFSVLDSNRLQSDDSILDPELESLCNTENDASFDFEDPKLVGQDSSKNQRLNKDQQFIDQPVPSLSFPLEPDAKEMIGKFVVEI